MRKTFSKKISYQLAFVHLLQLLSFISSGFCSSIEDDNQICSGESQSRVSCSTSKPRRYLLYDVNPGEGFNLRRDIYVRISPLINKLNREDKAHEWILVLPPWGKLPHWKSNSFYPWKTFFQIEKIQDFVPAMELNEFMDEYGFDQNLDMVFQMQHFPITKDDNDWREKISTETPCVQKFKYYLNAKTGLYHGYFWGTKSLAKNAECMTIRGQASTLLNFLLNKNYTAVMFDHAEVILWDSYGDLEWWQARKSLQFSEHLFLTAHNFLRENLPNFQPNTIGKYNYLGIHLRRKDFLFGRETQVPSLRGAAIQIFKQLKKLNIVTVFVATDGSSEDKKTLFNEIMKLQKMENNLKELTFLEFKSEESLSEGEIAIVDQILCSWSTFFIGTGESTFTTRIFEERQILGFDEDTTFNSFCPDDTSIPCKEPTRWKLKI